LQIFEFDGTGEAEQSGVAQVEVPGIEQSRMPADFQICSS